jgi:hypothetical protein
LFVRSSSCATLGARFSLRIERRDGRVSDARANRLSGDSRDSDRNRVCDDEIHTSNPKKFFRVDSRRFERESMLVEDAFARCRERDDGACRRASRMQKIRISQGFFAFGKNRR